MSEETKTTFTPEPWEVISYRSRTLVVAHPGGRGTESICELNSSSPVRNKNNGCLIAAAPTLYAACHRARDFIAISSEAYRDKYRDYERPESQHVAEILRAALSAADGGGKSND